MPRKPTHIGELFTVIVLRYSLKKSIKPSCGVFWVLEAVYYVFMLVKSSHVVLRTFGKLLQRNVFGKYNFGTGRCPSICWEKYLKYDVCLSVGKST